MFGIKGGVDLHLFKTTMAVKTNISLVLFHIVRLITILILLLLLFFNI